jgi:hypothetical protein
MILLLQQTAKPYSNDALISDCILGKNVHFRKKFNAFSHISLKTTTHISKNC